MMKMVKWKAMKINRIYRNKIYLDTGEIMDVSPLIRQRYDLKVNDDIERFYDEVSYEASLEKGIFLILHLQHFLPFPHPKSNMPFQPNLY